MKNIYFDNEHHEFTTSDLTINQNNISNFLSVILQVTRKCNLKCQFCSESEIFEDPSLATLKSLLPKLKGVERLYLSGGEPLLRDDIFEIIDLYRPHFKVLGLPSNVTLIDDEICKKLKGKINYLNAGLDGPREVNNLIRGGYDSIINGLKLLRIHNIEVSLSTVILNSTLPYLDYVVQIADVLDIKKVKMVIPVSRGRAIAIPKEDFASEKDIIDKFNEIKKLKDKLSWNPRIKFTFWNEKTEGYAVLVYPNRKVYAWPVFNMENSVRYLGDLTKESIIDIWNNYPYKQNHIRKYTGLSMNKC